MILLDTSVWADHLRKANLRVVGLLSDGDVVMHPFVLGEIAMGNLHKRSLLLTQLKSLPFVATATDEEVLNLVEAHKLFGTGVGYVDCHLLASCRLAGVKLLSNDKRLAAEAARLGVAA